MWFNVAQNSIFTRASGAWGESAPGKAFVRDGGSWKKITSLWVRNSGLWENVWHLFVGRIHPDSDIDTSGWTSTPLFEKLDEVTPDDASTEITSGTVSSVCLSNTVHDFEVGLSNPTLTPTGGEEVTLKIRAWLHEVSGVVIIKDLRVQLKEGANVRATLNTVLSLSYTTESLVLSQAEKDSITDWDNLSVNVRTTLCMENPGGSAHSHVTWIELDFS
ncbi:hypothetical protein LCGC14_2231780 [marine sediment metagenome]|uniref:Uncharacterized protein n=1 Tax=marine sediment metagenome TaxID=412755 RepID=A0A0F9D8B0_9ZZZZ